MSSLIDPTDPDATFKSIETRVLQLEAKLGVFYSPNVREGEQRPACPAENCNQEFSSRKMFYEHLRAAEGAGHRALRSMLERKVCLACRRSFAGLNGLTAHEQAHAVRAGQENRGCRVTNALPFFDSKRPPEDYSEANKDGERPCRQIARAFESLAEREDDQASKELVAMLFAPAKRAHGTMTNGSSAGAGASRKKRAHSEVEELHLDPAIWDSQQDARLTNRHRSKRRKRSTSAGRRVPGSLDNNTNLGSIFEGDWLARPPWTSYRSADLEQTAVETIENGRDRSRQIAGANSKPDNDNGSGKDRMRSAAPSPTDSQDDIAIRDEEFFNQLNHFTPILPESLFESEFTIQAAKLNPQLIISANPTSDHMDSEPTYDEDSLAMELLENFDGGMLPEVPNLSWSAPNSQWGV
ncbi:MAG: hypothetical protein Q9211_000950 [Gyalolechia sp. 1 TL-2023]